MSDGVRLGIQCMGIMGNTAGQGPNGLHFLYHDHPLLDLFALGDVPHTGHPDRCSALILEPDRPSISKGHQHR